jgi:hypothetical protein
MKKNYLILAAVIWGWGIMNPAATEAVEVSGLADFVARNTDKADFTNDTFKGFSNFHTSRIRLFFDDQLSDNSYVFVQILVNNYTVSLYGAYARFENVVPRYLNIQLGFLPTPVGTYAARTYSNINPLIGTPLVYNYHSALNPFAEIPVSSIDELIALRDTRSNLGLPIIYDACWNSGIELYGSINKFGYSVGALAGSVSKPLQEQRKVVPQGTTRLSYAFDPGLAMGVSGYYGPYLFGDGFSDSLRQGKPLSDYRNSGAGYDVYVARGLAEVYSEGFYSRWEYPSLPTIAAWSGYIEAKYKFLPGWYVAGRYDIFEPQEVPLSSGAKEKWDYAVRRVEFGLGYKVSRNVLTKLVNQINRLPEAEHLNNETIALQVSIDFR